MRCLEARELLSAWLEGDCAPSERAAVGEHLLACAPCRELRDAMGSLASELGALEHAEQPTAALMARLDAVPLVAHVTAVRAARRIAARRAAAWAIVFLGAAWQLGGGAVTTFAVEEVLPAASDVVVAVKQRATKEAAQRDARGDAAVRPCN